MNVVDQRAMLGDVQIVQCFRVFAVVANVIECLLDRPMLLDDHIVGRHETSDGIFRPIEQG